MATHFLIKADAGGDSFYQSLVVDAADIEDARRAVRHSVESSGCRLLTVDPSHTREVTSHPAAWPTQSTPFGDVSAGGRVYVLRRFSGRGLREVTSMEYSAASPQAALTVLETLCRESRLVLAVTGARVSGARRVRCGLSVVHMIDPDNLRNVPEVLALLEGQRERYDLFVLPVSDMQRIIGRSGLLCRSRRLKAAMAEAAWCIIEDGDFLCREGFGAVVKQAIDRAAASPRD